MNHWTDDDNLSVTIELDTEPEDLDLQAGLGAELLDIVERGQIRSAGRGTAPDGTPWDALAAATVRQKGHSTPGIVSGQMISLLAAGDRDIGPRSATWLYPADRGSRSFGKAHGFHNGRPETGQPARPLIGISTATAAALRQRIADEIRRG